MGSKASVKDKRKGDRHRAGYWVEYGRKRRAKERAEKLSQPPPNPKPNSSEKRSSGNKPN